MNVLLSSVGRRSYLVRYFQEALAGRGRVVVTNSVTDAPAMRMADRAHVVPNASEDGYIQRMLEICQAERIDLLCSLHDWEAPFLAANAEAFRAIGVCPMISRSEVIRMCLDKGLTGLFCAEHQIRFPKTFTSVEQAVAAIGRSEVAYPLMIKPACGQGSIELYRVQDEEELRVLFRLASKRIRQYAANGLLASDAGSGMLIQEMIQGIEYGLDVVHDLDGRFAACLVKRKLAMRAGETDAAETIESPDLTAFGRKIGEALGHIGMLDVDVMVDEQGPCLLELNPRFGGHYPFSHMAGANVPAALVAWAEGRMPEPQWLRVEPGVRYAKDIALVKLST
jgi:carbamoyl-phosphate synthase large subunit